MILLVKKTIGRSGKTVNERGKVKKRKAKVVNFTDDARTSGI